MTDESVASCSIDDGIGESEHVVSEVAGDNDSKVVDPELEEDSKKKTLLPPVPQMDIETMGSHRKS